MASFTDKIPQFNPYVQQLPVEAMVKVGMQKQAQYEEGVQKIQTSIDNITGLDVANPAQQKYLQSKLNALGNNLKTVAAGDFSNFQLVNSTAGMAKQISKDSTVINAVNSTSVLRKQKSEMEKAISEGKSSQSNIYDFNEQANKYLNSEDVNETFNGRYTQYTDVKKKALDAIKLLHPNLKEYDIPFEIDANGNPTGKMADAMKRLKIEGIDEGQIKQAISAALTPDDMNQLFIDAKYQFRGTTPEILKEKIVRTYDDTKKQLTLELEQLNEDVKNTTNPTEFGQITKRISQYNEQLGIDGKPGLLDENFKKRLEIVNSNPNEIKFDMYKEGFINEYANAFKWKSQSSQYVASPLTAQRNFVAELNYKQQALKAENYFKGENLKVSKFNADTQRERNKIAIEKMNIDARQKALNESGDPNAPWTPLGNPTDSIDKSYERFIENKKSVSDEISSDNALLLKSGKNQNSINILLKKWQDSQGTADIADDIKPIIARMAKNNNYLSALNTFNEDLKKSSYDQVYNNPDNKKLLNNAVAGKPSLNLNYNGTKISLTPQEILGLQSALTSPTVVYSDKGTPSQAYTYDLKKLNANQQRFVRFKNILDANKNPQAESIKATMNKTLSSYSSAVNVVSNIENKANENYLTELSKYSNAFVPQIKAVAVDKTGKLPTKIVTNLTQLIYGTGAKAIEGDENYNTNTARSFLDSDNLKNTKLFVEQNGKNYRAILSNSTGPDQIFQIAKSDVVNYFGENYVNNLEEESSRLVYGRGNTNLTNNPLKSSMQKQFGDFSQIKNYQITADVKQRLDNSNSYIPGVNIKKKDGTYTHFELYPLGGQQLGFEQSKNNLNMLNDELLEKALMLRYPNFDFSTLLKQ